MYRFGDPDGEPCPFALPDGPQFCVVCGHEKIADMLSCRNCGSTAFSAVVLPDEQMRRLQSPPSVALVGPLADLVVDVGAVILIAGRWGLGKTSVALQALARPILYTAEMRPEALLAYEGRLGAELAAIMRLTWPLPDVWGLDGTGIILDSISAAEPPSERWMDEARRVAVQCEGCALVIGHETKAGRIAGSHRLPHLADVVIHFRQVGGRRVLDVQKSRYGPATSYALDEPMRAAYYTIDGEAPSYRLVAWPERTRWSDPLARAERGLLQLPDPPLVVCHRYSRLSGWTTPEDLAERRSWLQRMNLPLWSPP